MFCLCWELNQVNSKRRGVRTELRIESMGYATYDFGGGSVSEFTRQPSLFAWEKEQKAKEDKASKIARTLAILYAMEVVWSAKRLMTPVTMDTIMELRQLYLAAGGHLK